jgi:hypothetical protein
VGIVGIGIGAGYGLSALSKKNEYDRRWSGGSCGIPPEDQSDCVEAADAKSALDRAAIISTIGLVAGGIGVATGLYLVLTAPSSQPSNTVRIAPMFARSTTGVTIAGSF